MERLLSPREENCDAFPLSSSHGETLAPRLSSFFPYLSLSLSFSVSLVLPSTISCINATALYRWYRCSRAYRTYVHLSVRSADVRGGLTCFACSLPLTRRTHAHATGT